MAKLTVHRTSMKLLAAQLSTRLEVGRIVQDHTGLTGNYDFELEWQPELPSGFPPPADASGPTLFTALEKQLGLKLEPQKAPVETIVIEHLERPSEN